jgi:hypothetical protein
MNQPISEPVRDTLPDAAVMERLMLLCIEELTASHTYQIALTLPGLSKYRDVLSRCYGSHRSRASALAERITALQGKPPKTGGIWSPFLSALGPSPATLSAKTVLSLLGDAETHWMQTYRDELAKVDPRNREFLRFRIVPGQDSTYEALQNLKRSLNSERSPGAETYFVR